MSKKKDKKIYFTITGMNYFQGQSFLKPGMKVQIEKEPDNVFCKPFLHKIAKSFCRLLHLHFVGNCKALAGRTAASHIAIADHI